MNFRIGQGYDAHRLVAGRKLILGGKEIPFHKGLCGHSDADVLSHAIIDALLGAAAIADIGELFPDTNEKYENISSMQLLWETSQYLAKLDYIIENIDSTIVAEAPKLSLYRNEMQGNISAALGISASSVSVKFTTEEGLGFTGTSEGIAAHAICLIRREI